MSRTEYTVTLENIDHLVIEEDDTVVMSGATARALWPGPHATSGPALKHGSRLLRWWVMGGRYVMPGVRRAITRLLYDCSTTRPNKFGWDTYQVHSAAWWVAVDALGGHPQEQHLGLGRLLLPYARTHIETEGTHNAH